MMAKDKRPLGSIQRIDPDLMQAVKVDAARQGKTMVKWWHEAAREKLERDKGK